MGPEITCVLDDSKKGLVANYCSFVNALSICPVINPPVCFPTTKTPPEDDLNVMTPFLETPILGS